MADGKVLTVNIIQEEIYLPVREVVLEPTSPFTLIDGLELAVFMMDKWDEISMDQRKSMIGKLQELIVMSKKAYGEKPAEH